MQLETPCVKVLQFTAIPAKKGGVTPLLPLLTQQKRIKGLKFIS